MNGSARGEPCELEVAVQPDAQRRVVDAAVTHLPVREVAQDVEELLGQAAHGSPGQRRELTEQPRQVAAGQVLLDDQQPAAVEEDGRVHRHDARVVEEVGDPHVLRRLGEQLRVLRVLRVHE